ncbi:MAG: hypothetical protein KUG72_01715 [Pseudomonadales bacterium]|nr:hypothetical protein [Pseudomonadales bacterium]
MEISHQQLFRVDKPLARMEPKLSVELQTERVDSTYKSVEKANKGYAVQLEKQKKNPAKVDAPENTGQSRIEPEEQEAGGNLSQGLQDQHQARAEQAVIQQLKLRDQEVRAHERAHASVGGAFAGPASFSYTKGPNGALYARAGEVGISTSPVAGDPQATLQKARQIKAAAMAPVNPSAQDRAVAARAGQMAAQAIAELASDRTNSSKEAPSQYIQERTSDIESSSSKPVAHHRAVKQLYDEISGNTAENKTAPLGDIDQQA